MESYKDEFAISTDKTKLDVIYIHQFLVQSYWAENIPEKTVRKSIEGSVCFGVYSKEQQIGFARVITDHATFGYIGDVFIDEKFRGLGLSKWLMETIMSHPDLQGFRSWNLATRDAHTLYAKFGFKHLDNPQVIMRKYNPEVYTIKS